MIDSPFQIQKITVPNEERLDEQMGSKAKFWFGMAGAHPKERPTHLWKCARLNTFEDISEKLTAELGILLGIPVAAVELAQCDGARGTSTASFLERGDRLDHGNQVLARLDSSYPSGVRYGVAQHTVEAVIGALDLLGVTPWPGWGGREVPAFHGSDVFVGYLLFDAWIGNTDRHHENWAVLQRGSIRHLAPSYDHASSLGRTEPLARIQLRLRGNDPRCTIQTYADGARSAFYAPNATTTLHPVDAFLHAEKRRPDAGSYWRRRLNAVRGEDLDAVIDRVPMALWSEAHGDFVKRLLKINYERILAAHV